MTTSPASAAYFRDQPVTGRMLIGGELVESLSGNWIESINPATEDYIGKVPRASARDVELAVAAGERAQPKWAGLSVVERSRYLLSLADAIEARTDSLLAVEVADTGNPINVMRNDIVSSVSGLRHIAGLGYEVQGTSIPASAGNIHFTLREPYGVVGRIVAFNHPIAMAISGLGAPIITGNCVIIKPAEQSPLSASLLGEIVREVLPAGVVGILSGDVEVGDALVRHPRVKRLSFIGSPRTGMAIQRSAAEVAVKHITLELGGKNPFIVFPDADVDRVAQAAVVGMNFNWQGQSCSSTSRLFVHDAIYDAVLEKLAGHMRGIRVGDPYDPATYMGAINSANQYRKVTDYVGVASSEGARLVAGGRRPEGKLFEKGYWIEPTLFADVRQDMAIAREEVFGPVLSMLRWSDMDEVIDQANSVDLGLTAAVWTNDITRAMHTVRRLQAGYIWVNGVMAHVPVVPYGGYKNSGVGRERGTEELYSYTEEKAVHLML